MSRIDILLCFDRRFLIGAAATIRSISESASKDRPLGFHVFHSDLRQKQCQLLRATAQDRNNVSFEFYRIDRNSFSGMLRSRNMGLMAYARLLAGNLPSSTTRLLYLDVDVLVHRDIAKVFDLPLEGNVLAAVPNGPVGDQRGNANRLGMTSEAYFATGLMMIDLQRWRSDRIGEQALKIARTESDQMILHDQDALNRTLDGAFLPLPDEWCMWVSVPRHWREWADTRDWNPNQAVIHFAMNPKPWHSDYAGPFQREFFDCLDRTPFRGWRPPDCWGIAPLLSRSARKFPYPLSVVRVLRRTIKNWVHGDSYTPRRSDDSSEA